ncbi:MAG TPA: cohesin domain-containing protein [Gammaproteobacteria bacterium]
MRRGYKSAILFSVLGAAAVLVGLGPERIKSFGPSAMSAAPTAREQVAASVSAPKDEQTLAPLVLPARPTLGEPGGALFGAHSWQPPAPKVAASPASPVAPPMPYRFAGRVVHGGKSQIFLSKGDTAIPVSEGQTLDGSYRVESIEANRITLRYLPLNSKEFVPIAGPARTAGAGTPAVTATPAAVAPPPFAGAPGSAARLPIGSIPARTVIASAAPSPAEQQKDADQTRAAEPKAEGKLARLLWDGPARVKLGAQFSVALRLTSDQPVHASPMQVRFDPTLLETVAVKPGRFFGQSERNFTYRVNSEGSIFIGASSRSSVAASDVELFVLTFRPIKTAASVELSIASLNLQGTAGRTIAFDPLAAFKTAIIP